MSDSKKNKTNTPKFKFNFYWVYGAIFVLLLAFQFLNSGDLASKNISRNRFSEILKENDISKIVIENKNIAQIFLKDEALKKEDYKKLINSAFYRKGAPLFSYDFGDLQNFENQISEAKAKYNLDFDETNIERTSFMDTIIGFLPFIVLIAIWLFFMRRMSGGAAGSGGGGQIFNIGKSKAKLFDKDTKVKTTFENVAGLEGAKEEVQEIVDFLKNPEKYTSLGGKIPKGALLVGPPGTGKTLLAKAVAGEADVPFFSLSGSDFVEMFVGVGASRVRDLFKQAQQKSPSIIFIDEIDAIGRARGKNSMTGGNDERENTLNQLLTEMDGFGTDTNVIVLAATNRADVLDSALMRAGRFDRQIYVDLPNINEREEIFKVHIKPLKLAEDVNIKFLAQQTPGFSGADIANMCNEAALIAARNNQKAIHHQAFLDAVDRIVGGLEKKNKVITPKEKKTIAFHEAGHATVSWMLEHAAPLVKVTIVPRGQSLGAAWYLPAERMIVQTEQMLDEMCATLGGRAAEKIIFNKISTGALSDLEKVTKQARAMVTVYGLNEAVGNVTYYDSSGNDSFVKPYSEETAKKIDTEISKIIEGQYTRAIDLLEKHKEKLTVLAELLLEKEVIFKDDLEKIFGKRPFEIEETKKENVITVENKTEE
ncbi:ATP-dependent zinc metalloprotease FtsH [Tenacibaculum maritimum]|uniref:ATP-dependent zinc metalloprotease FtsH n=1 Tax=Tenacibaculum maritimum TaxID=107401 RepID=UPI0012E429C0|nr:ATP-dependent zinc metalloprotease FtsH [Tenacibaculum maritimum]CAA0166185.1 ATP-dependent zinc metalloprotease FtsH [Tenacibaculum maritimum]CAA0166409.1 ATP-dependent zinc metalloprotease FtsH [Tenacibaculum maritimum]CAA0242809.1 ATP-dependent zinc metalloprotease FtsH [Tenacibaculum maritimum]